MLIRPFIPPGPVAARFLGARDAVGGIMGPIGSAKTSTALVKRVYIAAEQKPGTDGVRRTKHVIIRSTTRELEKTTIPTWLEWFPRELGHFTGGSGGVSARHQLQFAMPDSSKVDTLVEFIGLNEHKIEDVMRGYEGTTAVGDEGDLLAPEAHEWVGTRLGRFPKMDQGGPTYFGQDLMFNAPDTENYCYSHFVENPRDGYVFYRQPGGLIRQGGRYVPNPLAENLANLPADYYLRMARTMPAWMVRRLILNEFGYSRDGEPVYPEFDDARHVAQSDIEPIDAPLEIGGDAGLQAAVVIGQRNSFGQVLILDELVAPETGMGAEAFGEWLRATLDTPRYKGLQVAAGWADPAGNARSATDEQTWRGVMQRVTKFPWRPASTNQPLLRQEAVRVPLMRNLIVGEVAQPGLLLSPRCKALRKGFNGGYRFKRIAGSNSRVSDEAEKNRFSHPHDALQYLCLGMGEGRAALRGRGAEARKQLEAITDDNPDGSFAGHGRRQAFAETD